MAFGSCAGRGSCAGSGGRGLTRRGCDAAAQAAGSADTAKLQIHRSLHLEACATSESVQPNQQTPSLLTTLGAAAAPPATAANLRNGGLTWLFVVRPLDSSWVRVYSDEGLR